MTQPALVGADKISAGDTAWMLTSTALVLMMCVPGLALFYGGMVRKKNVLATLMQSFACTCVVTILWWVVGYSWAFTPGNGFIGGLSRALFSGMTFMHGDADSRLTVSHLAPTIPETVYAMFQMTFAIITPALIAGAFADRMKFSAMLLFLAAWSLLVYVPIAHMVWEPTAGSTRPVCSTTPAARWCTSMRESRDSRAAWCSASGWAIGREAMPPHNLTLTLIGASLLWVGWFGFNAGSATAADGRAGMAMLATQMATAAAALGWMFTEWVSQGKAECARHRLGGGGGLGRHHARLGIRGAHRGRHHRHRRRGRVLLRRHLAEARLGLRRFAGRLRRALASAESSARCSPACSSARKSAAWTARCSPSSRAWPTTLIYGFVVSYAILMIIDKTHRTARHRGSGARGARYLAARRKYRVA